MSEISGKELQNLRKSYEAVRMDCGSSVGCRALLFSSGIDKMNPKNKLMLIKERM